MPLIPWAWERKFWALWYIIRYPRDNWRRWQKWRHRPAVGDRVEDCRGQVHAVTGFEDSEDDLVLDDGSHCSWMHCCDYPPEERNRK